MSPSDRFDLKLRLSSRISSFSGTLVDLVLLNDAPVPLAYEVIKYGKLILCMDPEKRVDYETFVLRKYLDRRFYDKRYSEQNLARIARGQ
jgi:predicted nucleotidyltransferase